MQGQAAIQTKMVFTPATLNAKFHRRLVEAVEKRHVKAVRVRCALCPKPKNMVPECKHPLAPGGGPLRSAT